MKFYTRVALYALVLTLVPLSYTYADDAMMDEEEEVLSLQEAAELVNSLGTADDAVGGTVSGSIDGYYDLYARQLSFREKSKVFRGSIEVRRESFEYAERVPALEQYKDVQEKVFKAETAAYQEALKAAEDEEAGNMEMESEEKSKKKKEMVVVPDVVASNDDDTSDNGDIILKEIPVPEGDDDMDAEADVKKKVVTSDDAPDFDPSNL